MELLKPSLSAVLTQVHSHDVKLMLLREQTVGEPRWFAFDRDTSQQITVAPRPDRAYLISVTGTKMVRL